MKKTITYLFILLVIVAFGNTARAGGGPDAYGYTWLDSNDPGGPVYNWVDITTVGTLVSGLADDNSVGPMGLGFLFHYYWSDFDECRIGSNGWIGFDNTSNIAHCFPRIPNSLPTGQADNFLAPFMSDLNFAGTSPGQCYTWTNGIDSFIVSYVGVPWWQNGVPDWFGSNTFQVILSSVDSSITFQYKSYTSPFNNAGCIADLEIGIENSTGAIGLECWNEIQPDSNYAIKFYYPDSVLILVQDATPAWNQNTANGGEFYQPGLIWLTTDIKNTGNAAFTTPITVDGELQDQIGLPVFNASDTLQSLGPGADQTVVFSPQVFVANPAQYAFVSTCYNPQDINPNNDMNVTEVNVLDLSNPTATMSYAKGATSNGSISWNGGGTDDGSGVYMKPPLYPVDVVSLEFFVNSLGVGEPFIAELHDDDGLNGAPGTVLFSDTIYNGATFSWNVVNLPVAQTFNSGGFYVAFKMGGPGTALGVETASPFSRRCYEVLGNQWAAFRYNNSQDLMIRANITGYPCGPSANYTYQDSSVVVDFANSSNNANTFVWDFGDGNTSTSMSPSHTYAAGGTYNVCLIATNGCGSDTTCQSISLTCPVPASAFTVNTQGISANFVDQSTDAGTWFWDFGDGTTSTQQNPNHVYSNLGTYTVCLTVSSQCGTDSSCQTIQICSLPGANFFFTTSGLNASFSDFSSGAMNWNWDFGDGNTSTMQNPNHTYTQAGTYNVCLAVDNNCNYDTLCKVVTIVCPAVTADFNFNVSGLNASFTDITAGATTWSWDFGDGNTSTQQNPAHTYAANGSYTVCLIARDSCGPDTSCKTVAVCAFPVADFNFSQSNFDVDFTDMSTGGSTWTWDFGDGNSSTQQSPSHTYAISDTFTVCLIVSDSCGTDTFCQDVPVLVVGLETGTFQNVRLWPNPHTNEFALEMELAEPAELQFVLRNVLGQELINLRESWQAGSTQHSFSTQGLAKGVYFLEVVDNSHERMIRKVVKE